MRYLKHIGVIRRSGRYPWGSGNNPQRNPGFRTYVLDMKKQGLSESEIAKSVNLSVQGLRDRISLEKDREMQSNISQAETLKAKGYSNTAIAERMGRNESTIRSWLAPAVKQRSEITDATANMLKDSVDSKGMIDVGVGVERHVGVSRTKLKTAIAKLEEEGYKIHYVPVTQLGTGKTTSIMVLASPEKDYKEVYNNREKIKLINSYSEDGGRSYIGLEPIRSINSKKISVKYAEEGGADRDGLIELRRGVDELSLGSARYAQVRIGVDGKYYLKGMAVHADDLPSGVDVRFNTNKKKGTPLINDTNPENQVAKAMKNDPDNPFGATVRQKHFKNSKGEDELSALNIVNEEGDWGKWSKSLSSQMLSKQPNPTLAKTQLDLAYRIKKDEYDEIMELTNPAIKKKLLQAFSDDCDSSAVHLKAAAMPRQASHVILPFSDLKDNEIYAPNYRPGEQVVLIRYPHGGTFEIPELQVTHRKSSEANKIIGRAKDAVGINSKVAARLSGADFDGDTVLVIPNPHGIIRSTPELEKLKGFDPKKYKLPPDAPNINPKTKQIKMGDVSNLITDMTIKGAEVNEIAAAVRHSMVVIDSEKHHLDYKQSYKDNNIGALKAKYQGSSKSGAATLISKASSEKRVNTRTEKIDPETGKITYTYTDKNYVNKQGKTVYKTVKTTKMAETDDAFTLSSGTTIETIYANHANKLKSLANTARKDMVSTKPITYSPSAKKTYSNEVASLQAKLNIALKNAPLERQAQLVANYKVKLKKEANPNYDADDLKKLKGQELTNARLQVGAKKKSVNITPKEWEAIQAGAVSNNTLTKILDNADLDVVKQLATPRQSKGLSTAQVARVKNLMNAGYTQSEIADNLGVSVSVINNIDD